MSNDESSARDRADGEPSGAEPAAGPGQQHLATGRQSHGAEQSTGEIGYAKIARRISGWTTNLLATAVVVLIAVLLGRHLVALWRSPAAFQAPQAEQQLAAFDDPFTPIQIEFGNSPLVLHRQPLVGTADDAVQQLSLACAEQLQKLSLPALEPVSAAEAALLARVTKRPPLKRIPPDGALYQLDESMPVIVGTKQAAGGPGSVGNLTERVVTWGIAVPGPDEGWTLYAFGTQGDALQADSTPPDETAVPLPPGAERILTMRWPGGGGVTAFRGAGGPEQWSRFFDNWFADRNGALTLAWRVHGEARFARYSLPRGDRMDSIDIQFSPVAPMEMTKSARWRGMITETRADG